MMLVEHQISKLYVASIETMALSLQCCQDSCCWQEAVRKGIFTVGLENYGKLSLINNPMSHGAGNPEQIAELEWFTEGNAGYKYRATTCILAPYTSRCNVVTCTIIFVLPGIKKSR